jgi:hypothetical protein
VVVVDLMVQRHLDLQVVLVVVVLEDFLVQVLVVDLQHLVKEMLEVLEMVLVPLLHIVVVVAEVLVVLVLGEVVETLVVLVFNFLQHLGTQYQE